jgi:hypothetical protein
VYLVRFTSTVHGIHVRRGVAEHRVGAGVIGEPEKLILQAAQAENKVN